MANVPRTSARHTPPVHQRLVRKSVTFLYCKVKDVFQGFSRRQCRFEKISHGDQVPEDSPRWEHHESRFSPATIRRAVAWTILRKASSRGFFPPCQRTPNLTGSNPSSGNTRTCGWSFILGTPTVTP